MYVNKLPSEIHLLILSYLPPRDILNCGLVNKNFHELINTKSVLRETWFHMGKSVDDPLFIPKPSFLTINHPIFNHYMTSITQLSMYNIYLRGSLVRDESIAEFFNKLTALSVQKCHIRACLLEKLLQNCSNLKSLQLSELQYSFQSQTFLQDSKDRKLVRIALKNVNEINLSDNHYLSDEVFKRIMSCLKGLRSLDLSGNYLKTKSCSYNFFPMKPVLSFKTICDFLASSHGKIKCLKLKFNNLNDKDILSLPRTPLKELHIGFISNSSKSLFKLINSLKCTKLAFLNACRNTYLKSGIQWWQCKDWNNPVKRLRYQNRTHLNTYACHMKQILQNYGELNYEMWHKLSKNCCYFILKK